MRLMRYLFLRVNKRRKVPYFTFHYSIMLLTVKVPQLFIMSYNTNFYSQQQLSLMFRCFALVFFQSIFNIVYLILIYHYNNQHLAFTTPNLKELNQRPSTFTSLILQENLARNNWGREIKGEFFKDCGDSLRTGMRQWGKWGKWENSRQEINASLYDTHLTRYDQKR